MVFTSSPPRIAGYGLVKTFQSGGRPLSILGGADLEVHPSEFVAILGPSGSGKSTLLGLLAGLDRPTEGRVEIDAQRIDTLDEDALAFLRREKVGFVFQSFQLLGNLTALENVALPLELSGRRDARDRAHDLLARVGLDLRRHHYPSQLSGGEQQRVALARAFAPEPSVLLADEPTGNLDRENGAAVLEIMSELRRRQGTTLILVTHDQDIADRADRQLLLLDGVFQEVGVSV